MKSLQTKIVLPAIFALAVGMSVVLVLPLVFENTERTSKNEQKNALQQQQVEDHITKVQELQDLAESYFTELKKLSGQIESSAMLSIRNELEMTTTVAVNILDSYDYLYMSGRYDLNNATSAAVVFLSDISSPKGGQVFVFPTRSEKEYEFSNQLFPPLTKTLEDGDFFGTVEGSYRDNDEKEKHYVYLKHYPRWNWFVGCELVQPPEPKETPYASPNESLNWSVSDLRAALSSMQTPEPQPDSSTASSISFGIVVAAIALFVVLSFLFIILTRQLLIPAKLIITGLQQPASSKLGRTQIKIGTKDEFEQIADELNRVMNNMELQIAELTETQSKNKNENTILKSTVSEFSATATNLQKVLSSEPAFETSIKMSMPSITTATEHLEKAIEKIDTTLERNTHSIEEARIAIKEMTQSLQSISTISEEKYSTALSIQETANKGAEQMESTMQDIQAMAKSAGDILELVEMINSISETINLLAMNAAIEAAHAGDAGKGFAVVADEIRKLAETTGENTGRISNSVTGIIEQIKKTAIDSRETNNSISSIAQDIHIVADSLKEILSSLQEMSINADNITNNDEKGVSGPQTSGSEMVLQLKDILESTVETNTKLTENAKHWDRHLEKLKQSVDSIIEHTKAPEESNG